MTTQLWIARDADGSCEIYSSKPWYSGRSWISPDGGKSMVGLLYTEDCQSWPETWIPPGPNGLRRLLILDPDSMETAADAIPADGTVSVA